MQVLYTCHRKWPCDVFGVSPNPLIYYLKQDQNMSRKRKFLVGFWLDDNEYLSMKNKISQSGLTCSGYLRKSSLDKNITVIPGIRDLIIEIKRIGNNLNQITRAVNEGSLTILGDNLKNIKYDLKAVWGKIAEALKKI